MSHQESDRQPASSIDADGLIDALALSKDKVYTEAEIEAALGAARAALNQNLDVLMPSDQIGLPLRHRVTPAARELYAQVTARQVEDQSEKLLGPVFRPEGK